jgi:hypothetical protein
MTQKEIFDSEKENLHKIHLYKEGIFWKAYERSAFHFCQHVTPFKPTRKFVKTVGFDVVSIGFPTASIDNYKDKYKVVEQAEARLLLTTATTITEAEFERWKDAIVYTIPKNNTHPKTEMPMDIISQIKSFNLESKTPMECMMWLAELKQQLNI